MADAAASSKDRAVTLQRIDEFDCQGFFATNQTIAVCCVFRAYEDGTLTGQLRPVSPAPNDPVCYMYDGRASKRANDLIAPKQEELVYDCSFKVVRVWRNQLRSQFLVGHTRLSRLHGIQGHYVVVGGGDERPLAREVALPIPLNLLPTDYKSVPLLEPMLPLMPGTYRLKGYSVTSTGVVYECTVVLQLLANGSLQGTSSDVLFPLDCALRGEWSQDQIAYTLQYKVSEFSSSNYIYTMKPHAGGLRGKWAHEDGARSQRSNESGHVELFIQDASRIWSPAFHRLYPRVFKDATKLLLLKALRAPERSCYALPSAVWQHVLAYCDYHHFCIDGDHQQAAMAG